MTRKRKRKRGTQRVPSHLKESREPRASERARALSRARHGLLLGLTLAIPVLLFALVEGAFRLSDRSGGLPLFVDAPFAGPGYVVANRNVGRRWFSGVQSPPGPMLEPFSREKPARAFRIFVLGESSAAGFPYPRNATFSRLLRDVLRDVLPGDSVEVVNLGVAATNSYAMLDMVSEVARQRPDAVLIYAGHNEYYGALGVASREGPFGSPAFTRTYLRLLRLRSVLALRGLIASARGNPDEKSADLEAASLMELLAREKRIPFGGDSYRGGVAQFESNIEAIVRGFLRRDVPVFLGSLASNLRDQPPFAADANDVPGGARPIFLQAKEALARGDTAKALELFTRARDLDVVRFRAPGEFNAAVRRVSEKTGARYVGVAEAFARASADGIAGAELFLEHVHPNRAGYSLIARAYYEALANSGVLPRSFDARRLRPWPDYERKSSISSFDERVALHAIRTLTARWPFVAVAEQADYRARYRPASLLDSLAFDVSRGTAWEVAKLRLAADYERRGHHDSAAVEYAGLARDAPLFEEPWRLLGKALLASGQVGGADSAFRRAVAIKPTAPALATLGALAVQRRNLDTAVSFFRRSLELDPDNPNVLYQASLAYGMRRDLPNARSTAERLAQIAPQYPGLGDWLGVLGLSGSRP